MLVEVDAQLFRAPGHLLAVDAGRERRLLELLPHGPRLEGGDAVRTHEPAGVDEAAELVAGEERLLELCVPGQMEMLRVREDGLDDLLGVPLLPQDRCAVLRVLVERRVHLVVEIVEKSRHSPELLVLPEVACVSANGGLDREGMTPKRLARGMAGQRVPGLRTCGNHRGG